jgi:hypothetical protein
MGSIPGPARINWFLRSWRHCAKSRDLFGFYEIGRVPDVKNLRLDGNLAGGSARTSIDIALGCGYVCGRDRGRACDRDHVKLL